MSNSISTKVRIIKRSNIAWSRKLDLKPYNRVIGKFNLSTYNHIQYFLGTQSQEILSSIRFDEEKANRFNVGFGELLDNIYQHGHGRNSTAIFETQCNMTSKNVKAVMDISRDKAEIRIISPYTGFSYGSSDRTNKFSLDNQHMGLFLMENCLDLVEQESRKFRMGMMDYWHLHQNGDRAPTENMDKRNYFLGRWEGYADPNYFSNMYQYITNQMVSLGYSELKAFYAKLALMETVNNGITHGHGKAPLAGEEGANDPNNMISVSWRMNSSAVQFMVEYSGASFDPIATIKEKLSCDRSPRKNGNGLVLMSLVMDSVIYSFEDGDKTTVMLSEFTSGSK